MQSKNTYQEKKKKEKKERKKGKCRVKMGHLTERTDTITG